MKRVYYKVLAPGRVSCIMRKRKSVAVHYPPCEWATPQIPHSKLAVFSSYWASKSFYLCHTTHTTPLTIVRCHIRGGKHRGCELLHCSSYVQDLRRFWAHRMRSPCATPFVPTGTVLADAVYCLE